MTDTMPVNAWLARLHAEWDPILTAARKRGVPVLDPEDIGGGLMIAHMALSEDPNHYAWLGTLGADDADGDGPFLWTAEDQQRGLVGGYAYKRSEGLRHPNGWPADGHMSERITVEVLDPDDNDSIADAIHRVWRKLKEAECPDLM
jgi:hypothetical protein